MAKRAEHECDCCGHATSGYSRTDLEEDGWVWHIVQKASNMRTGGCVFVMCGYCEQFFAERRALAAPLRSGTP